MTYVEEELLRKAAIWDDRAQAAADAGLLRLANDLKELADSNRQRQVEIARVILARQLLSPGVPPACQGVQGASV